MKIVFLNYSLWLQFAEFDLASMFLLLSLSPTGAPVEAAQQFCPYLDHFILFA